MSLNMYFECRKRAAVWNEKLNSREGAAELLGISESSLAHYELGITKSVPVDVVVLMSEIYKAPELKCLYCKTECPVGKNFPIATESGSIEEITVQLLDSLDEDKIKHIIKTMIKVAADGTVSEEEMQDIFPIVEMLNRIQKAASKLKLMTEQKNER